MFLVPAYAFPAKRLRRNSFQLRTPCLTAASFTSRKGFRRPREMDPLWPCLSRRARARLDDASSEESVIPSAEPRPPRRQRAPPPPPVCVFRTRRLKEYVLHGTLDPWWVYTYIATEIQALGRGFLVRRWCRETLYDQLTEKRQHRMAVAIQAVARRRLERRARIAAKIQAMHRRRVAVRQLEEDKVMLIAENAERMQRRAAEFAQEQEALKENTAAMKAEAEAMAKEKEEMARKEAEMHDAEAFIEARKQSLLEKQQRQVRAKEQYAQASRRSKAAAPVAVVEEEEEEEEEEGQEEGQEEVQEGGEVEAGLID